WRRGSVERGCRLVQDDQFRMQHQGTGEGNALALPARDLLGVSVPGFRVQADVLQGADDTGFVLVLVVRVVNRQAFADNFGNGHARAQAAERVLEHNLDTLAPG